MTLQIDVITVTDVLLPDSEWHQVAIGSFKLNAYELVEAAGGRARARGRSAPDTGFQFRDNRSGKHVSGPTSSILAVQTE
jgi:hypothetical protein